jgi:hypothetical protein
LSFKVTGLEFLKELNLQKFNNLANVRDTDLQVLWTVGCSITQGVGVSQNQRWGHLLSEYLNIPEVTLSSNGSSIRWAADQILRSDIRLGDTVVWGLTSIQRYEWSENWQLKSNTVGNMHRVAKPFHYWKYEYFDSTTHISLCIREILHVIQYCKKIGAKLYLANLYDTGLLPIILADYENFIDLTANCKIEENLQFIDYGNDNSHPGPLQHKIYADQIFNMTN